MEPLLRPWFETVDRLLPAAEHSPQGFNGHAPRWRLQLYGGDAGSAISKGRARPERAYIDLVQEIPPRDQRRLREAFELFALALRIDGAAFMAALARGMPWVTRAWTYEPFADDEKLRLRLPVDSRSCDATFFRAFQEALRDASAEFQDATQTLRAVRGSSNEVGPMEFHLQVQLEIVPGQQHPALMTEMLRRIDRAVFVVTKVYVILSPELETRELAELVELYRMVHGFRDTAEVETHFDVPIAPRDRTKLLRWKWFFDLTARKTYGPATTDEKNAHPWIVAAMFGQPAVDRRSCAKATSAAAFLSALAHAGSHATAASFIMALQDPTNDRHVRAKYLGYLMRTGRLQKMSFRDVELTREDVTNMLAVYNKPSREEALRALYHAPWHGRKGTVLDDKIAKKYLTNANEVIGVLDDSSSSGDDSIDVFLAGFGQCGVSRALQSDVRAMQETAATRPAPTSALTSLDLLFLNGNQTVPSIVRLATGMGRTLEHLRIENEEGTFQVMSLFLILEACRALRTLSIKQVALTPRDDKIPFTAPGARSHALESLSVVLAPTDESSGLAGLATLLGNYGSGLKELELIPTDMELYEPFPEVIPVLDALFGKRLPVLTKLRVRSFNSEYVQALWDRERVALRGLDVLILETVAWAKDHWTKFMDALSDPSHPLAQSVRTLHLQLNGWEKMTELQAMLRKNQYLSNVAIDFPEGLRTSSKLIQDLQATNGRAVHQLKKTLSVSQKTAFVSALTTKPLETHNLSAIVDYAATTATRYVRVSLANPRAD